ncbi:MAG: hypothetical protein BroJett042_24030 [Bacteroidota bacterium]|nr:MAG: hypothetical protein BroJett042_24030 [Bacteroidota bacterium]
MTNQQITDAQEIEDLEVETLNAILKGEKVKVIKLLGKVEYLFNKSSDYTRSLIANKFIFPLTQLLEMNYSWGCEYLNLFPSQLKAEYRRQINSSGI